MSKDYTAFDAKMLELIGQGKNTAALLTTLLGNDATPLSNVKGDEFRVIDRRLQALRKKGLIRPERKGRIRFWVIAEKEAP